jgi:hypothetical protein
MSVAVVSNTVEKDLFLPSEKDALIAGKALDSTSALLSGPLVWTGGASISQTPHTLLLERGDIEELRGALEAFKGGSMPRRSLCT